MTEDEMRKELAKLEAENASATSWGAAVGARHERIKNIKAALRRMDGSIPTAEPEKAVGVEAKTWRLGAMNDGVFIIDSDPRPSTDDIWPDRPDGPTMVLNVTDLPQVRARAIVDAHNAALSALQSRNAELVRIVKSRGDRALDYAKALDARKEELRRAEAEIAKLKARLEQADERSHPYEDPLKAIEFAQQTDEGLTFLRLWTHGEWPEIDRDWPEWSAFVTPRQFQEARNHG